MQINPVLENEMKRNTRSMRGSWVFFAVNLTLVIAGILSYFGRGGKEMYLTAGQYRLPMQSYRIMAYVLFGMICILVPGIAAGSISMEREKKTLDLLLITKLSPWKIIAGKLEAVVCMVFLISVSALPVLSLVMIFGGISILDLFSLILSLMITGIFLGSISVFCSSVIKRTTMATILAYIITIALTLGMVMAFVWGYFAKEIYTENTMELFHPGFGPWIYLLYLNPLVIYYGMLIRQSGNGYELIQICNYLSDYSNDFGIEHMVVIAVVVQLVISVILIYVAGRKIDVMRR